MARRTRSVLAAVLAICSLLASMSSGSGPIASAADPVATTTTLTFMEPTYAAGSMHGFYVQVSPAPPSGSLVHLTFTPTAGDVVARFGPTDTLGNTGVDVLLAPGGWTVRAAFEGTADFLPSESRAIFDVVLRPSAVVLEAASPTAPGSAITLDAYPTLLDTGESPSGSIAFYDTTGDQRVVIGTAPIQSFLCSPPCPSYARLQIAGRAAGTYEFEAEHPGNERVASAVGTATVVVAQLTTTTTLAVEPTTVPRYSSIRFGVTVRTAAGDDAPSGTIKLRRLDTMAELVSAPITLDWERSIATLPEGTFQIRAEYVGTAGYASSMSAPVTVTVTPDVVSVSGVGTSVSTFYPYKDSYLDTVAIKGTRLEGASVAIRVYAPTGSLVRSVNIATANGAYSTTWTGRNSAGSMLAAGKYKVVQSFTDTRGTKKTVTTYVTLSHKRIVTKTVDLYLSGTSTAARGATGSGTFTTMTGGVLRVSVPTSGWAGAGYRFVLPAAAVYKSLSISAYVKAQAYAGDGMSARLGVQDYRVCAYSATAEWNESCFKRWATVASSPATTKWTGYSISPTYDRSGRTVRAMITTRYGNTDVVKLRLRVTYGVLQ